MQFGRGALRAKELAIRGALGATRGRLVRQMLTESLLIAVLGTVVGVLLAHWSLDLITSYMRSLANPPPSWRVFSIDGTVLLFTIGVTLVATIASGLIPAMLSSRQNPAEVMKEGGRG
ncbi:MAG: FtsX-like permease family protein, partial [Chthoniobacterales bacterium]|nr:FtsX-like permease family protein [Chthoniobacterales bacterium]